MNTNRLLTGATAACLGVAQLPFTSCASDPDFFTQRGLMGSLGVQGSKITR